MNEIIVSSKFNKPTLKNVQLDSSNILKETDKSFQIRVERLISDFAKSRMEEDGSTVFFHTTFEDLVWIPKSQIRDGFIQKWFLEKESLDIVKIY